MRNVALSIIFLLVGISLFAVNLEQEFTFEKPEISTKNGYSYIEMDNAGFNGDAGQPRLPTVPVSFLLPWGEEIDHVVLTTGDSEYIALDKTVYPIQQQYPLSKMAELQPAFTQPDNAIYSSNQFPTQKYSNVKSGILRGHTIVSLLIYPVSLYPKQNLLEYYPEMKVEIVTKPATETPNPAFIRNDAKTMSMLAETVVNPDMATSYPAQTYNRDREVYDYLIITDAMFVGDLQPLVDYKTSLGWLIETITIAEITAQYTGNDLQEQIRNCIIDQYSNNGISYVLLVGDVEFLPHRGMYVHTGYNSDSDIPCDDYYYCLDGNWNTNGNNRWGEFNEADFYHEVFGGRMSVDSAPEIQNFINKTILYQQQPIEADLLNNLLVGEDLGWQSCGMDYMEEVRLGSNNNGYSTAAIPAHINTQTLYDAQGTWSTSQLFSLMNSGMNLIGHLGHCNVNYNMKFYNSDVNSSNIQNDGLLHNFYIIYTQGCYCNSFDNRESDGTYTSYDAIAEKWTTHINGPVCYVGNTRYGWGDGYGTDGASQRLHRQFYDALYGEDISIISEVQTDSKSDCVPYLSSGTVMLWAWYQCTLMGEPTLDVWTNTPPQVILYIPDVLPIGIGTIQVAVSPGTEDPENLMVSASHNGVLLARSFTDATGMVDLNFTPDYAMTGHIDIYVSGHNILDTHDTIDLINPDEAYIVMNQVEYSDNNDQQLSWNETINMSVSVYNVGNVASTNLTGVLSTDCPYITITQDNVVYNAVAPQSQGVSQSAFELITALQIPVSTVADFIIDLSDGTETWQYEFSEEIVVPNLILQHVIFVEDSGNGNNIPDANETFHPDITFINESGVTLENLQIRLYSDYPDISITPETLTLNQVAADAEIDLSSLQIQFGAQVTPLSTIVYYLEIECERDYVINTMYNQSVPLMQQHFETQPAEWTHYMLGTGWIDQWHYSQQENHTPTGLTSWKSGDLGWEDYNDNCWGALESPPVTIPTNGRLTFWHKIDAENSTANQYLAFDGGYVEISTDGTNWITIQPFGGYPYTCTHGSSNPIPVGQS
ncbi:MAG: hypothetical protein K8S56_03300, partial [Candidatus Cloacimonetes bacterium]|nr:hypothetical protein [Candidatus Cloacimonadota bacterium]